MDTCEVCHCNSGLPGPGPGPSGDLLDKTHSESFISLSGSLSSTCSMDTTSMKTSLSSISCVTATTNHSGNIGSMSGGESGELSGKLVAGEYAGDMACCNDMNESKVATNAEGGDSSKSSLSISDESETCLFVASANKPHKANDSKWEAIQAFQVREGALGMDNFRLLKRLGCGDIGSVYLAELKGANCCFAMKVMDKRSLASRKKLLRAQTEREILQCLDHPFLPSLYTHFETDKFSCLVMEFCPGGDLHILRQRQPGKHFSEPAARFYAAEVLLALEYLHMMGVIYRDLKPENILVRQDGHIMLSDFDLSLRCAVRPTLVKSASTIDADPSKRIPAYCVQPICEVACITPECVVPACIPPSCLIPKILTSLSLKRNKKPKGDSANNNTSSLPELIAEPTGARSMSFVGTHEYLAPEIIKGEGHGSAVDWWTFGIFLYELLYGKTPFKGVGNRATLFNVIGQPLKFPDTPTVSYAARDLISGLLVKDPQHRLAYKRGSVEIKQHPFFEGVNWALIRSMAPPEIPRHFDLSFLTVKSAAPVPAPLPMITDNTQKNGNSVPKLDIDFF